MLTIDKYDESYFEGREAEYAHNAGYSSYVDQKINVEEVARRIHEHGILSPNDLILDAGCAYGFAVEKFRELGYEAWGCEVSDYALSQSTSPYLFKMDIFDTPIEPFDVIFTSRVLPCIENIEELILHLNQTYKKQIHVIDTSGNAKFYNIQPIEWWRALPFENTILIDRGYMQKLWQ